MCRCHLISNRGLLGHYDARQWIGKGLKGRCLCQNRKKWRADRAVNEAEARLKKSNIVGNVPQCKLGFGYVIRSRWSKQWRENKVWSAEYMHNLGLPKP